MRPPACPGRGRTAHVRLRLPDRHDRVVLAVHAPHGDVERQLLGGVVALVLGGVAVFAYFGYLAEQKRLKALQQIAAELGFDFSPAGDAALLSGLGQ